MSMLYNTFINFDHVQFFIGTKDGIRVAITRSMATYNNRHIVCQSLARRIFIIGIFRTTGTQRDMGTQMFSRQKPYSKIGGGRGKFMPNAQTQAHQDLYFSGGPDIGRNFTWRECRNIIHKLSCKNAVISQDPPPMPALASMRVSVGTTGSKSICS